MSNRYPDDASGNGNVAPTPHTTDDLSPSTITTSQSSTSTAPMESTGGRPGSLQRERAERGPSLGGALAIGMVVTSAVQFTALVWMAVQLTPSPEVAVATTTATTAPTTTTARTPTTMTSPGGPDPVALAAAIDAVERQSQSAGIATRQLVERAERAERVVRARATQKLIARARDARRAAGQSGPALKGPFPIDELGNLADLELSTSRWLVTRDGAVVAPAGVENPVPSAVATTGRDEDVAAIPAMIGGVAATLNRYCIPFEPWCLIDVASTTAPPPTPAVDVTALRALVDENAGAASITAASPATTTHPTPPAVSSASTPTAGRPSGPARWPLLALGALSFAFSVVLAARVRRLGTLLRAVTWRLRTGLTGRMTPHVSPGGLAELGALESAIDEAFTAIARLASLDDDHARRRNRLEAVAAALHEARNRGGLDRLEVAADDDAATARVAAAVNALLETLDARHRRIAMVVTDAEGAMRLITALSQRLLRLARLEGLPPQAAEEFTSLGTSLGQWAGRLQVLPGLLEDLAPLAPPTSSIIDISAATLPLGDDGIRLAARQLEGGTREH